MEGEVVSTATAKVAKPIFLYVLSGLLFFTVVGLSVALGYVVMNPQEDCDEGDNSDVVTDDSSDDDDSMANTDGFRVDVNDGYVEVPANWQVSKVISEYDYLDDDEITNACPMATGGAWPIHRKSGLAIERGDSRMQLEKGTIFVPGGFGGVSEPLADTFEVIVEPTIEWQHNTSNRNMYGVARKLESGVYEYHLIVLNDSYDPDAEDEFSRAQYFDMSTGINTMAYMTFSGDASYLSVADAFYTQACQQNTSGWCE